MFAPSASVHGRDVEEIEARALLKDCEFRSDILHALEKIKIFTVRDFLEEENPIRMCEKSKISLDIILKMTNFLMTRVVFFNVQRLAYDDCVDDVKNILPTGIKELDEFLNGGLRKGNVYELCGLSSSGKSQICMSIAAGAACLSKRGFYIDTKGDFSCQRLSQFIPNEMENKMEIMGNVVVSKIFDIYELISTLLSIKPNSGYSVVIIDSICSVFFQIMDQKINTSFKNYVGQLLKYISVSCEFPLVMANLGISNNKKNGEDASLTPALGKDWSEVCCFRIWTRRSLQNERQFQVCVNDLSSILFQNEQSNKYRDVMF